MRILAVAVLAAVLITLGLLLWPARYVYEHDHRGRLVRVNRLAPDQAEVLHPRAGWLPVGPTTPRPLPTPPGPDPYADIFETR